MLAKGIAAFSLLVCLSAHAETSKVEEGTDGGQWRVYGGDKAGTKYSPLEQINPENYSDLEVAWRWVSVDDLLTKTTAAGGAWSASRDAVVAQLERETPNLYRAQNGPNYANFQATPLMIDGVLYFNTPLSQGVAVDAKTHATIRHKGSDTCRRCLVSRRLVK